MSLFGRITAGRPDATTEMVQLEYDGRTYHTIDGRKFYLQPPTREKLPDPPRGGPKRVLVSWVEVKHPRVLKRLRRECEKDKRLRAAVKANIENGAGAA